MIVVVTGGGRGVGKGIALALGESGDTVYVTDRDASAEETAAEVTARGGHGVGVRCDHTDDAQTAALFGRVRGEGGGLDLLVANAFGGNAVPFTGAPVWEQPAELWEHMFTSGVRTHLMATRLAAPLLWERPGSLVAVTTYAAEDPDAVAGNVYYDVAMHASNRLVHGLARDLGPRGVTVVGVSPGFVRTETILAQMDELPPGTQSPEYVGRAVVALAGDPEVARHAGRVLQVSALARAYGFTDLDGTQP